MATPEQGAAQPGGRAPAPQRTSGLALASLILGIVTIGMCLGPFAGIPAVVCGHLARRECRREPAVSGDGLALAGLIIGYVGMALWILLVLFWFALFAVRVSGPRVM